MQIWKPILITISNSFQKLIQRKPINRLGLNGPEEVKKHPWIKDYAWDKLLAKDMEAPFIPNPEEDNFDSKNMTENKEQTNEEIAKQNALQLRRNSVQSKTIFSK